MIVQELSNLFPEGFCREVPRLLAGKSPVPPNFTQSHSSLLFSMLIDFVWGKEKIGTLNKGNRNYFLVLKIIKVVSGVLSAR